MTQTRFAEEDNFNTIYLSKSEISSIQGELKDSCIFTLGCDTLKDSQQYRHLDFPVRFYVTDDKKEVVYHIMNTDRRKLLKYLSS